MVPTFWRRRAIAMAILGLVVAVPITVAVRGGGESETAAHSPGVPALDPPASDRALGVSYRVPVGWRERERSRAISLRSRDRTVEVVIASPAPVDESRSVLNEALAAVRSGYRRVRIERGAGLGPARLGGARTDTAVASARTKAGIPLRILVAVARGDRRAYLVEVFTAAAASGERVRQAQVALNSLRFTR